MAVSRGGAKHGTELPLIRGASFTCRGRENVIGLKVLKVVGKLDE